MRKLIFLLAVFGLAGSLWAADPLIGKWKLNVHKSKLLQAAPKEFTEIYREVDGNLIELTATWIGVDGSSNPERFTFPKQGGINKFSTPIEKGRHEIEVRIAPGDWFMAGMQDGKQTVTRHKVISKDGKTMQQTIRYTDSKGAMTEEFFILEKQ